jgi:hypothetical protein
MVKSQSVKRMKLGRYGTDSLEANVKSSCGKEIDKAKIPKTHVARRSKPQKTWTYPTTNNRRPTLLVTKATKAKIWSSWESNPEPSPLRMN